MWTICQNWWSQDFPVYLIVQKCSLVQQWDEVMVPEGLDMEGVVVWVGVVRVVVWKKLIDSFVLYLQQFLVPGWRWQRCCSFCLLNLETSFVCLMTSRRCKFCLPLADWKFLVSFLILFWSVLFSYRKPLILSGLVFSLEFDHEFSSADLDHSLLGQGSWSAGLTAFCV